jgi:hypothetical protein
MSELRGQKDVWNHLLELMEVVRGNTSLEGISVKQAVGLVMTEVCNLCEGEEGMELLAEVLVREELLVPDKEFLDSLEGDAEGKVMVPRQLGKGKEVGVAWVVVLAEGIVGVRSNKLVTVGREQVDLKTLERWLDRHHAV